MPSLNFSENFLKLIGNIWHSLNYSISMELLNIPLSLYLLVFYTQLILLNLIYNEILKILIKRKKKTSENWYFHDSLIFIILWKCLSLLVAWELINGKRGEDTTGPILLTSLANPKFVTQLKQLMAALTSHTPSPKYY